MSGQHTPGPWVAERMLIPPHDKDRRCGFVINGPEEDPTRKLSLPVRICDLRVLSGVSGFAEGEANARLLAAAPELLEALEALTSTARTFRNVPKDEQEWTSIDDTALEQAFAALAKAKGGK